MARTLRFLAAAGALLSLALVGLALFNLAGLGEQELEFLIVLAPALLLPAVFAMHRLFRPQAPRLSQMMLITGAGGIGAFLVAVLAGVSPWAASLGAVLEPVAPLLAASVTLPGLWLLLAGLAGWRTAAMPWSLVGAALVSGLSWLVLVSSALLPPSITNPAGVLFSLNILVWLLGYTVWTVGLAYWLLAMPPIAGRGAASQGEPAPTSTN